MILNSQPDVSPDSNEETPEQRNETFHRDISNFVYLEVHIAIQAIQRPNTTLFILEDSEMGLTTMGVIPITDLKHQKCASLTTRCLLYSRECTYLWGRTPRPSVSHDKQKANGQEGTKQKEKKNDETYLGYREHSLTVYLLASHARNR